MWRRWQWWRSGLEHQDFRNRKSGPLSGFGNVNSFPDYVSSLLPCSVTKSGNTPGVLHVHHAVFGGSTGYAFGCVRIPV